jgi:hypothetical protein
VSADRFAAARRDAPAHDEALPAADAERRALLQALAAGERRLGRAAIAAIAAEGAAGTWRNLRLDVDGAVAVELADRPLYLAAAMWDAADRRGLWRALRAHPAFAERVVGYGLTLLGGEQGDPQVAWKPFGAWVFGRAEGWARLRNRLAGSARVARELAAREQGAASWARPWIVLTWLAGHERQIECETLLELAAAHGGWFTRLRARGALAEVGQLRAAAHEEAAAAVPSAPAYPDLIPLSHFGDVAAAGERPEDPGGN